MGEGSVMDMVRPVFQRPRTVSAPIVKVKTQSGAATTVQLDMKPTDGQQWIVNFARIVLDTLSNYNTSVARIYYFKGATSTIIAQDGTFLADESLSIASFGNGPIIVDSNNYLRMEYVMTGGGSFGVNMVGLAEVM